MNAFFYPTQANNGDEWFSSMLDDWRKSGKSQLCFPFFRFKPHTLPASDAFWMFMYYRQNDTDALSLQRKVKYRIHVTQCSGTLFPGADIHTHDFGGGETIWFLCDRAEEIRDKNGSYLSIDNFSHKDGKQLASAIRSSIAPIVFDEKNLLTVTVYP